MVTCIAYVETNFLMGVATGRESQAYDLVSVVTDSIRIAIPSPCYIEAFSAFEDERKRRNGFKNALERQIGQLRRDLTLPNAKLLLTLLEEAQQLNDRLLSDVQGRLFQYIDRASTTFDSIDLLPAVLKESVNISIIKDPTDNLILHMIVDHARRTPSDQKALLTGNFTDFDTPDVRSVLQNAGVAKFFRTIENLIGWLRTLLG